MNKLALLTLVLATTALPALAHDYWLEARAADDGGTDLHLYLGDCLTIEEERPYQPERTVRFTALGSDGETDLTVEANGGAKAGDKPIAQLPATSTARLAVLERNPSYIELEPKKFGEYLAHEGLDGVVAARIIRGEAKLPGRERYRRFLKVLMARSGSASASADKPDPAITSTGQRFELIPVTDPGSLSAGSKLSVRLVLDGKPLEAAPVTVCQRDRASKVSLAKVRTNAQGVAELPIKSDGLTLIRAVQMRRVADGDPNADWESFWTSYSFEVPPRPDPESSR